MRVFSIGLAGCTAMLAPSASAPAFAGDWYVDASVAAGGTGSMASPFRTIR
jgi:hypothetical protein